MKKAAAPSWAKTLPLYAKGGEEPLEQAIVSEEDLKRLSQHKWFYDESTQQAYREVKIQGRPRRIFLHREALGCVFGDGKTVVVKDGNKLNCARSNLELGFTRTYNTSPEGKFFPRKLQNFLNYVKKNCKNTPLYNLLTEMGGEVEVYNSRELRIIVDSESDDKRPLGALQQQLQEFLEEEFAFKGKVHVVRQIVSHSPAVVVPEPKALPVAKPQEELSPLTSDAPALVLARIQDLAKSVNLEYLQFGVRDPKRNKIHKFQYSCEDVPTSPGA